MHEPAPPESLETLFPCIFEYRVILWCLRVKGKLIYRFLKQTGPENRLIYNSYTLIYGLSATYTGPKPIYRCSKVDLGCIHWYTFGIQPKYTKLGRNTCRIQPYVFDVYTDLSVKKEAKMGPKRSKRMAQQQNFN